MRPIILAAASLALLAIAPAFADDVTGEDHLLGTTVRATECFADGGCFPGSPTKWSAPRFVKLDFKEKMLRTTEASGEDRSTPMKSIEREGDRIFIQGVQDRRAFSIVLDQDSGTGSTAFVLDGHVLALFSCCTPNEATGQIDQQVAQQQAATAQQVEDFKKAFSVCLEAKDYLVKF